MVGRLKKSADHHELDHHQSKYPRARIALLSSPMASGTNCVKLQNCLAAIKATTDASYPATPPVALFFFAPMRPHGCGGHPDVADHALMAKALEPFFKKLLDK